MSARIHILGICGTFMAGLALLARAAGFRVSGSDSNVYPPMSTQLTDAGIEVREGFSHKHLQPAPDLVIVGNAMTRGNPALEYLLNSPIPYTSGPQWLAEHILRGRWVIAVAGTHGKTTTSAMLAWILEQDGLLPGFLIGGMPHNFNVSARLGAGPFFVIEADEYDSAFFDKRSKFIHYRPRTVVLNNLEFDHADIFPNLNAIKQQFHHFVRTLPAAGLIISNGTDAELEEVLQMGCWTPVERLFVDTGWEARDISADGSTFSVFRHNRPQGRINWSQLGRHNVANAVAAIAAAHHVGVAPQQALTALTRFQGVKRRMELIGSVDGIRIYDDFAHHPSAIALTLAALRHHIKNDQRIVALLELRSNTMRRGIFNERLIEALQQADLSIICYDEHRGVEFDDKTFQAELTDNCQVCRSSDEALATLLRQVRSGDHILIMSNGGFADIHQRLLNTLKRQSTL